MTNMGMQGLMRMEDWKAGRLEVLLNWNFGKKEELEKMEICRI